MNGEIIDITWLESIRRSLDRVQIVAGKLKLGKYILDFVLIG
jgi:hypothetical protein